jgi:hypothetical protein
MSVFKLLAAFVEAVVWIGGWSQLVGMPVAWLRVRRSRPWLDRPQGVRRIDLLAELILLPTIAAIALAWLTLIVVLVADPELSAAQYLALIWGPPTVFVPLAAWRTDPARLDSLIEERFRRTEASGAADSA